MLLFTLGVVLWGAYVRASGAGAGCGNHWPLCNGEVVPRDPAVNTIIEFTHRVMSGVDGALILVLLLWALRLFPAKHPVRLGAALSTVFLVAEALIGAALVKLEHVAQNASVGRAWSLSGHFVNTLTLVACLALTAWWADGGRRLRLHGAPARRGLPVLLLVVFTGIAGAIVALGDTLFPAHSLAAGLRQDLDTTASLFVRLRLVHPLLAVAAGVWAVFYAGRVAADAPNAKKYARWVAVLAVIQVLCGAANWLLLAPVWMQMIHLLLADTFWIALVLLVASTLQESSLAADIARDEMVPGPGRFERAVTK